MKGFKITLFIILMLVCVLQTVRHVYVLFTFDTPSVLDKYDVDQSEVFITKSQSLKSLLDKYDSTKNAIAVFEKDKTSNEIDSIKRNDYALYTEESTYRYAIQDWERKEKEIHEVITFWLAGFFLVILGLITYSRNLKWLGMVFIISGFIEMIWWSSPILSLSGATQEFLKLLSTKLILSLASLIALVVLWVLNREGR